MATQNQIAYYRAREEARHNLAYEKESARHNYASERLSMFDTLSRAQTSRYATDKSYESSIYGSDRSYASSVYSAERNYAANIYKADLSYASSIYSANKSYEASRYATDIKHQDAMLSSYNSFLASMNRDTANKEIADKDRQQKADANMWDYNAKVYAANRSYDASYLSAKAKAATDVYAAQGRLLGSAINAWASFWGKVV